MINSFIFHLIAALVLFSLVFYYSNGKSYKNNLSNKILLKKLLEGFDLDLPDELKEINNRSTNSQ